MLRKHENLYTFWFENGASNVSFLEYNNGLIAFDSSLYPEKFNKMIELMEEKTSKKLKSIFLTHFHPDHSFGALFSEKKVPIIMNIKTYNNLMNLDNVYLKELSKKTDFNFNLLKIKLEKKEIELYEDKIYKIFDNKIISGKLLGGHSEDSCIYSIKPDNFLISGDLIFSNVHSEIINSKVDLWLNNLEKIKNLNINKVSPGHGEPGEKVLIEKQIKYLNDFINNVNLKKVYNNYLLSELIDK